MDKEGIWEYGLLEEVVCGKRRSVCGVCTQQYLSISMGGRSINNNNNNKDDDYREGVIIKMILLSVRRR
jgi:hypothetical protein